VRPLGLHGGCQENPVTRQAAEAQPVSHRARGRGRSADPSRPRRDAARGRL
jgi:hypothetical protein